MNFAPPPGIRQVKIARDTAQKGRTSAIITLKQIIVNAPAELRESLADLPDKALLDRCAGYRVKTIDTTTASAKHSLRALARRWIALDAEIRDHDAVLDDLTSQASPTLRDGYGIGPDTAAEILIVFVAGSNVVAVWLALWGSTPMIMMPVPWSR